MNNELSEMPMKNELKNSAKRHARTLIRKLEGVVDLPEVAYDSIRQELEYGTLDGMRITLKHTAMETENDEINYNR